MRLASRFITADIKRAQQWTLYSALIGILVGVISLLFYTTLNLLADITHRIATDSWTLTLLLLTTGGLAAGAILTLAPEVGGAGENNVIDAYHSKRGLIRARVPPAKTLASLLTIGTGGSAGREGPISLIGAGIASYLAQRLHLNDNDTRLLLMCGTAAGIGSIFRAPLGGAVFAIEVLYRRDMETDGLVQAFISSTVAYAVFAYFFGWQPAFTTPHHVFNQPHELILYAALGAICVPVASLFIHTLQTVHSLFHRLQLPAFLKPAIGAALLAVLAAGFPQLLGTGDAILQASIDQALPLQLMLILLFLKMLATSLTISSGGSGGLFAPTLYIGAMTGGIIGWLFQGFNIQPSAFVLVGMAAMLSAASKTPIAAIIMITELTESYKLLAPLMLASTLSYILSGSRSLYPSQPTSRVESPAHRRELVIDVLEEIPVEEVYTRNPVTVTPSDPLSLLLRLTHKYGHTGYPVIKEGRLTGIVTLEDVEKLLPEKRNTASIEEAMTEKLITTTPQETLEDALKKMLEYGIGRLPVVDPENPQRLLGILTKYDII
jgi:CIC family chloride channel protein